MGPRHSAGTGADLWPWLLVVGAVVGAVLAASVWLAGNIVAWVGGQGWGMQRSFGWDFLPTMASEGARAYWPAANSTAVWLIAALFLAAAAAITLTPVMVWVRHRPAADDPGRSLAGRRELATLLPRGAARIARSLRPSVARRGSVAPAEAGVMIGDLVPRGPELRASWESVWLAVMAPRAGKTTALAVPAILDAPGPVVATSNKADLWAATAELRAAATGERCWVFDPQAIAYVAQTWWWDPLEGITTVEEAHRMASHFVQEVRGGRGDRDFWSSAAHDLLTALLLAAGCAGRGLDAVYEWLNDPGLSTPAELLRENGHRSAASSLEGRQAGAPETRDGIYETARTAAQCLRDPVIMAWVTRPTDGASMGPFDPEAFVLSRQTLYLLSKDGAGAAAPLVGALADRVIRAATKAAERRGGRLDPPAVMVLDEAANVCRIADLPKLYSHLGSRGIVPLTILQSYPQGVEVWGEGGMKALWSASTVKLIGAGIDDAKFAEDISRLIGEHDVRVRSTTRGGGSWSSSTSLRQQRVMTAAQVRALPKGRALLFVTGIRAAQVRLRPWYKGPRAREVQAAVDSAEAELTRRASMTTTRAGAA